MAESRQNTLFKDASGEKNGKGELSNENTASKLEQFAESEKERETEIRLLRYMIIILSTSLVSSLEEFNYPVVGRG